MSIERIVTLLTPAFGAGAAWLTALIATRVPGLHVPPDQIVALEIAGFTGATAAALKWLHGRARYTELVDDTVKARAELGQFDTNIIHSSAGPALSDIEAVLKAHEAEIAAVINTHIPAAITRVLDLLVTRLESPDAVEPEPAAVPVSDPAAPPQAPANSDPAGPGSPVTGA